ncbi:MAG: adenylosuccinate lyase [Planctomycetes bacterium]|nr:adenylosuccinate lyase [Planctomycetota bacterium]
MSDHDHYQSPLSARYAGAAMRANFSERKKFLTWHRIWLALAESQRELGLPISEAQVAELRANLEHVDFELAARYERELRHDVMAHVHAWGERCQQARGILHLGATSCDVTDNADLVILRDALGLVRAQLVNVLRALRTFALEWKALPVLGLTHLQPAQATTLGKRATLWIQDFAFNLAELEQVEERMLFRGVKGTTGTQASFLSLFQGDHDKVRELERRVARRMGFEKCFPVTGQTYPRQLDFRIGAALAGIAQSGAKFGTDLRLLAARREVEEPFGKQQIGSSAMPWKRNPMRCERVCSLARHVISQLGSLAHTAANQWLERTLDDSAVRRLALPEMFLATDGLLELVLDVGSGLVVHPRRIERNLAEELPFLACEHLMLDAAKSGVDRQEAHEHLRQATHAAVAVLLDGGENPLCELLLADPVLKPFAPRLQALLDPSRSIGRADAQVEEFVREELDPLLARHASVPEQRSGVRV